MAENHPNIFEAMSIWEEVYSLTMGKSGNEYTG